MNPEKMTTTLQSAIAEAVKTYFVCFLKQTN